MIFTERFGEMSVDSVKKYLSLYGLDDRVQEFNVSSATVELAAMALGVSGARIAKTISLAKKDGGCLLIVSAGDYKIDNKKFKEFFGFKASMLSCEDALTLTGHAVGGVCPFDLPSSVEVYLDNSMRRFETVFPAAGSSSSAVELSCDELFVASRAKAWGDFCKPKDI